MLTSSPPRGIVCVGFWGCWVAVKTRRGALRAPAVTLNVGRLSCSRRFVGKVTLPLKQSLRLAGSPPPLTRTPKTRLRSFRGTPYTREASFLLLPSLVGVGAYDDPRSWGSNFAYGESQRLLRRSRCDARVLSVPLCSTTKTSKQLFRHKRVFVYKA